MDRMIITRVGDPANPQKKPNGSMDAGVAKPKNGGDPFEWFQIEVAEQIGLADITATRNLVVGERHSLNRDRLVAAMKNETDVSKGPGGLRIETVAIEPHPVIIDGVHQKNGKGEPVFQRHATIIVFPKETVEKALEKTNSELRLRGTGAPSTEPSHSIEQDSLDAAAVNADLEEANV